MALAFMMAMRPDTAVVEIGFHGEQAEEGGREAGIPVPDPSRVKHTCLPTPVEQPAADS
jgi:hypothetical protein